VVVSGWLARPFKLLAQQRQELIDAIAHEMRTPLTAIVGASRLLQQANLPEDKRGELLDMIAREALRLSGTEPTDAWRNHFRDTYRRQTC